MKNKNILKIINIIIMASILISISVNSFAAVSGGFTPNTVKAPDTVQGSDQINKLGNNIVGILQTVGVILSVVILIILGIKYMMGSSEEKAEYKKTMIPYIVGAALIFAASIFANVVFEFFTGIQSS